MPEPPDSLTLAPTREYYRSARLLHLVMRAVQQIVAVLKAAQNNAGQQTRRSRLDALHEKHTRLQDMDTMIVHRPNITLTSTTETILLI